MEEWRPVVGYEGLYEVSSLGRVKSLVRPRVTVEKVLVPNKLSFNNRYYSVGLTKDKKKKVFSIHRLVCAAFIGQSSLPVNHIDQNRLNNHILNLEYVYPRENTNHHKVGKYLKGVSRSRNKFKAAIRINGNFTHLGVFDQEIDAHNAYVYAIEGLGQDKYCIKHKEKAQG